MLFNLFSKEVRLNRLSSLKYSEYAHLVEFYNNQGRVLELYSDADFDKFVEKQLFIFVVKDVVTFRWRLHSLDIEYTLEKFGTDELAKYWLYHMVVPIALIFKDSTHFLHAGAVSYDNHALVFMANSHGGKSTLTDFFLKKGHSLITDDKLLTIEKNDSFYAIPSFEYHRPYREVESLGIKTKNFDACERKITSLYVLKQEKADALICFDEIRGIEKFQILKKSTEFDFDFLFKQNSKYLAKMSNTIKIYYVTIPWNLDRLEEVYKKIVQHQKEIT